MYILCIRNYVYIYIYNRKLISTYFAFLLCSFISKIIFKTVLLISHFHCVSYTIAHCDTFQMRKYYQLTCHTLYCFSQNSDGQFKPACVCKFNLGSLYVIMKIVVRTLIRLQVCANCWYESYLRAFE